MGRNETATSHGRSSADGNGGALPFLNDMPETVHSMLDANARLQSDFLTLWSHRAHAWLNWPKQVLSCKDAADLVNAEGTFLTAMHHHYREYFDSVMHDTLMHKNGKQTDKLTRQ